MYAAAWKTTAGRYFSKTWRIFVALPASASTAARRVEAALVDELALDLEQPRLPVVDEHESRRGDARELPAELGADRAAGPGYENDLAGHVAGDRPEVRLHRLAAEKVLHLDRPDLAGEIEVARDELV